jgi:hypothetical protein
MRARIGGCNKTFRRDDNRGRRGKRRSRNDFDLSWNEILTGTAHVRFFKLEGDKLSIRTAEQASAVYPGKEVVGTLT